MSIRGLITQGGRAANQYELPLEKMARSRWSLNFVKKFTIFQASNTAGLAPADFDQVADPKLAAGLHICRGLAKTPGSGIGWVT